MTDTSRNSRCGASGMTLTFAIHKHVGGCWSVEKPDGILSRLCWDEMLGEVAVVLMAGRRHRFSASFDAEPLPFAAIYSLRITEVEPCWYTIRRGSRFIDRLACNEALGFLAAYTFTDGRRQLFSGLMSYEQWRERFCWNRDRVIAGLMTFQPEQVA